MKNQKWEMQTKNGYDFYEVSSAMQKAIRRGDARTAGFFALELWASNYDKYVWKRLYTVSAEDCWGLITAEVEALHHGYQLVNENAKSPKGRIFISKAVILLCEVAKSRDSDHLQNLVYDKISEYRDEDIEKWIVDARANPIPIPEYAFDVHTKKGKMMGKTKKQFFIEEHNSLVPRQSGLFDDLIEKM